MSAQLSRILEYFEQLNELDTSNVEPLAHPLPRVNVFREDELCPSLPLEDVLANAPDREGNYFKVPRIIE